MCKKIEELFYNKVWENYPNSTENFRKFQDLASGNTIFGNCASVAIWYFSQSIFQFGHI